MQHVITTKLTPAEIDVLDWLVSRLSLDSRSECLRTLIVEQAEKLGLNGGDRKRMAEERANHLGRRSPKIVQKHGRRERQVG